MSGLETRVAEIERRLKLLFDRLTTLEQGARQIVQKINVLGGR